MHEGDAGDGDRLTPAAPGNDDTTQAPSLAAPRQPAHREAGAGLPRGRDDALRGHARGGDARRAPAFQAPTPQEGRSRGSA